MSTVTSVEYSVVPSCPVTVVLYGLFTITGADCKGIPCYYLNLLSSRLALLSILSQIL